MKNVLNQFSYKWSYYLTHPWKLFYEIWTNFHNAWERATKGYCYIDVANFDTWFLEIAPEMLKKLSKGHSYPGNEEFDSYEKWQNWLQEQANNLIACRDENIENKNEYRDEFLKTLEQVHYEKLENGFTQIKFDDSPDAIIIRDKYYKRNKELYEERQNLLQLTLSELCRNWFHLWD